jgi:hypothetical protein
MSLPITSAGFTGQLTTAGVGWHDDACYPRPTVEVLVIAQPADEQAQPVAPRYSRHTLRRIKHARVARDLTLCVGGVVFTVLSFVIPAPSYTVNDPIWIFALTIAVFFGIAAFWRGIAEPAWDRSWSRSMRYTCSIVFVVAGAYFIVFALDQSGYIGVQGSGVTTDCRFESSAGLSRNAGSFSYDCDLDVHWSDGTTTHESLDATTPVNNGQTIKYAKPASAFLRSLFPVGDQPAAALTQAWFYLLTGMVIFLQSLFALCVLIFVRKREIA